MALPDGVELRLATADDAEAGAALHRACWREAYGPLVDPGLLRARLADTETWVTAWRGRLRQGIPRWVAEEDGRLIGFGLGGPARGEAPPVDTELYAVYVRQAWYGTGVGQALLDQVIGERACLLWVLENNPRARAFYERNGFQPDGRRERFDPLDAWEIRMVRR